MEEEKKEKKPVGGKWIIYLVSAVVVVGLGIGVYYLIKGGSSSDGNSKTDTGSKLAEYDGKVVDISSTDGKIEGQMVIAVDESQTYPAMVLYFMRVNDPLPKVAAPATDLSDGYFYLTNHDSADRIRAGDGSGNLSEILCNVEATPDVLQMAKERTTDTDIYLGCEAQTDPWHESTSFYVIYGEYYDEDTFDYDRLLLKDTLAIFNEGPFYQAENDGSEYQSWSADDETVIAEGEISAQYELIYTE